MNRIFQTFCLIFLLSCGSSKDTAIEFESPKKSIQYMDNENVEVKLNVIGNVDSISLLLNNEITISVKDNSANISSDKLILGENILVAKAFKSGENIAKKYLLFEVATKHVPNIWKPKVLRKIPHDEKAFTQGLFFYNDKLYETTGERTHSRLMMINPEDGKVLNRKRLPDQYFGEGSTVWNNKIYHITWTSGKGFIFNPETLEQTGTFNYGKHSKEGWGLTTVDNNLVMSNGSDKLLFFLPKAMQFYKTLTVVGDRGNQTQLNELEYDGTYIYANVWMTNEILAISPKTGRVEAIIDCSELLALEKKAQNNPMSDVLNGIAYQPKTKTFFLTGKNWEHIYEVELKK
ncbi:glutamine cyclotransferase [Balneicella halophila]|uniref:Glutamine cyclotransferase n=1 Tax=Balneicella halophila TaxID=1537566 RepID=A0A7L4UR85_BALHA|nr:glutaminyl-peptide cyclotransferase [Balneicella halophila]PVX52263.1 glutamine cyclotransferase [Balneicella halophila]